MKIFSSPRFSIFKNTNFTFYLLARLLGTMGVQIQSVAVGWQVYQLTGSLFDLGLIGLAQFLPFLCFILIAGHAADRYSRRLIMILCMGVQVICALFLLAFTLMGIKSVWPIFVVLALFGCARAFMMPASQAILINLVPTELFGRAVAVSSSTFHLAIILGPVFGGLLYLMGPAVVYVVVMLVALCALILMMQTKLIAQVKQTTPATLHSLLEGLRFVFSRPVMLGAISLDLFAVLLGGATALLPAYAHDVLQVGPEGLGLLRTAPGVGAALMAVGLAWWPITRHVGKWMFGGVAVFGIATVVLGLSSELWLALFALLFMGAGDMVSVYIRHLLVQLETPDQIRGRVSAVNSVFIGTSNELGEFESGLTAAWWGLIPALIVGGCATLVVTVIWAWKFPVLRNMDRFPEIAHTLKE